MTSQQRILLLLVPALILSACDDPAGLEPPEMALEAQSGGHLLPVDLGTLGGTFSVATDLNGNGVVVGYSEDDQGRILPFIWDEERGMRAIEVPGERGRAMGINAQGMVTGWFHGSGFFPTQAAAFVWDEERGTTDISNTFPTLGLAINDRGQVVGSAPFWRGGIWEEDSGWVLSSCPAYIWLLDINDRGEAVGFHQAGLGWNAPGGHVDIMTVTGVRLPGPGKSCDDLWRDDWYMGYVTGINHAGTMAGVGFPIAEPEIPSSWMTVLEGPRWARIGANDRVTYTGERSEPAHPDYPDYTVGGLLSINARGEIVGGSDRWARGGERTTFEAEAQLMAINDRGEMAGSRIYSDGGRRATFWTSRRVPSGVRGPSAAPQGRPLMRERSPADPEVVRCPAPLAALVQLRALETCPVPSD